MEDNKDLTTPSDDKGGKLDIQEFGSAALSVFESIRFAVETIDTKLNKVSIGTKLVKTQQQAVNNHICTLFQCVAALAIVLGLSNAAVAFYLASINASDALILFISVIALGSVATGAIGSHYACSKLRARRWTDGDES